MQQFCSISCCADIPVLYIVGASDFPGDVNNIAQFRLVLRQLARVVYVFMSKMERIAGHF